MGSGPHLCPRAWTRAHAGTIGAGELAEGACACRSACRRGEKADQRHGDATGAQPARGGSHEGMGTANFIGLVAGAYLEIIGPDPDQPQLVGGRWFGIDPPASSPGHPYR